MNADTHLDLEELLAGTASEHLASCPGCQAEQARWAKVSAGTQQLMTTIELPEWQFPADGSRAAHRPRRRALLTAAAAAAVLAAGGTTWGVVSSGGGNTPTTAGLTAVTGCPGLTATSGTLEQLDGTQLVVRTPGGQTVTVSTSSSLTHVRIEETGSARDITDGTRVVVHGTPHGSTLTAGNVLVNPARLLSQPPRPGQKLPVVPPSRPSPGVVVGTVSDAHPGGFTVTQQLTGHRVHVTTAAATVVDTLTTGTVAQLRTGLRTVAVGQSGPDGTLNALSVEQGATLPLVQTPPSRSAAGSCDPTAVASALALG